MKRIITAAGILLICLILCGCVVGEPQIETGPKQTERDIRPSLSDPATDALPSTEEPAPETTEPAAPSTEETVPQTTEPAPETTEPAPETTETPAPSTELPTETETDPTVPPTEETAVVQPDPSAQTETADPAETVDPTDPGGEDGKDDPDTDIQALLARPASPYAEHVFSHQGTSKEEYSETFAAYDLVIGYGSRYIEQDLMISSDGVLYCSHDNTPKALTGETRLFTEMTSEEIDSLTVKDGQRLLRLSDVFERYGTAVTYVIELKRGGRVVQPFIDLVKEYHMEEHIIVQSSELKYLKRIESVFPDMPKLFLVFGESSYEDALDKSYVDIISVGPEFFTQEVCDRVHAAGKQFNVYVVNSAAAIRAAIEIGADSYFTDYTAKAFLMEELYRN